MNIRHLINYIDYKQIYFEENCEISNISTIEYNSKFCIQNSMFVAITGENIDGHIFIEEALKNGTNSIICEKLPENFNEFPNVVFILVENSRLALAQASHAFYNFPARNMCIIGITGTNGKTTTTFLLKSILEAAEQSVGIIGTTGIFIDNEVLESPHTTPESLELAKILSKMYKCGIEYVVMEVSSHSLAMHRVSCIDFNIAAFTNLTHEHLDFHKTLNNYTLSKKILFDNLDNTSIAVFNADDTATSKLLADCSASIILISRDENNKLFNNKLLAERVNQAIIYKEDIEKNRSNFVLKLSNNSNNKSGIEIQIETKLTAKFNIDNASLAATIAHSIGIEPENIKTGLASSNGAPGRMELVQLASGATAYVDYAHTPDALEKALLACKNILKTNKTSNSTIINNSIKRLIVVFGCGGDRDKTKRPLMGKIAEQLADIIIITDDNPRTEDNLKIIEEIAMGISSIENIRCISDRKEAIKYAASIADKQDIILVAGKGHETYQIIGTTKQYFSDIDELVKYS